MALECFKVCISVVELCCDAPTPPTVRAKVRVKGAKLGELTDDTGQIVNLSKPNQVVAAAGTTVTCELPANIGNPDTHLLPATTWYEIQVIDDSPGGQPLTGWIPFQIDSSVDYTAVLDPVNDCIPLAALRLDAPPAGGDALDLFCVRVDECIAANADSILSSAPDADGNIVLTLPNSSTITVQAPMLDCDGNTIGTTTNVVTCGSPALEVVAASDPTAPASGAPQARLVTVTPGDPTTWVFEVWNAGGGTWDPYPWDTDTDTDTFWELEEHTGAGPVSTPAIGGIAVDTTTMEVTHYWDGTAWQPVVATTDLTISDTAGTNSEDVDSAVDEIRHIQDGDPVIGGVSGIESPLVQRIGSIVYVIHPQQKTIEAESTLLASNWDFGSGTAPGGTFNVNDERTALTTSITVTKHTNALVTVVSDMNVVSNQFPPVNAPVIAAGGENFLYAYRLYIGGVLINESHQLHNIRLDQSGPSLIGDFVEEPTNFKVDALAPGTHTVEVRIVRKSAAIIGPAINGARLANAPQTTMQFTTV